MSSDISNLPTDPVNGGSIGGNISFSANENNVTLDQTTINQIVNGLQQASSSGSTQLQSRDISQNVDNLVQDPYIQPNFIPPQSNNDYISEYDNNEDIINNYNKNINNSNKLDQLYDEIQIPLLISILYFLFQLPIFRRYLYKFLPILFFKDGNINLYGFVFTSALFGMLYYILSKIMIYFSKF